MESEVGAHPNALPELKFLRIGNLTTFPADLEFRPLPGMNVVFGGNYSGKTTFVNAIKFGLFGLTLNRTDEELSARYFASRIRDRERKSLDIITSFVLDKKFVTVKRTLFLSGPQRLDVQVVDPTTTPQGGVVASYSTSRDYLTSLSQRMGLENLEEVKFVLELLLADEDRHTVLWRKDCESMIMKLLAFGQEYSQLRWLERELDKNKTQLARTSKAAQVLSQRLERQQAVAQFLEQASRKIPSEDLQDSLKKLESLRSQREQAAQSLQDLQIQTSRALDEKSSKLQELSRLQSDKQECLEKMDQIRLEKYRAIMYSEEPEGTHIMKHLVHQKRCPYCDADLSSTVEDRESRRVCIFCGNEIAAPKVRGIEELNSAIADQKVKEENLTQSIVLVGSQISEIDSRLRSVSDQVNAVKANESAISRQLSELAEIQELERRMDVAKKELQLVQERMKADTDEYRGLLSSVNDLENEQRETLALQKKGEAVARNRMKDILLKVSTRFGEFVRIATNGELSAELSADMVPSLRGIRIHAPEDASLFERTLLDMGFRIAVISCLAEIVGARPFLVFETPDEISDEAYLPYLARALAKFCEGMSIVITSSSTLFTKEVLQAYPPANMKEHFIDLSGSGSLTQKSYYFPRITEWTKQ